MNKSDNSSNEKIIKGSKRGKMITRGIIVSLGIMVAAAVFVLYAHLGFAEEVRAEPICGIEEHSHSIDEGCYEKVLICGFTEEETTTEALTNAAGETTEDETAVEATEETSIAEEETTEAPTADEPTTEEETTEALTTAEPTTEEETTEATTTDEPTTEEVTTVEETTVEETTEVTTVEETTEATTTAEPTAEEETTVEEATEATTTAEPTAEEVTTIEETTEATTEQPNDVRVRFARNMLSIFNIPLLSILEPEITTEPETTTAEETTEAETTVDETTTEEQPTINETEEEIQNTDETQQSVTDGPDTSAVTEPSAEHIHVHTDECYEYRLICEKPEHTHTTECYPLEIGPVGIMGINGVAGNSNSVINEIIAPVQNGSNNLFVSNLVNYTLGSADDKLKISATGDYAQFIELDPATVAELNANGITVNGTNLRDGIFLESSDGGAIIISNLNFRFIPKITPYNVTYAGDITFELVGIDGNLLLGDSIQKIFPISGWNTKCLTVSGTVSKADGGTQVVLFDDDIAGGDRTDITYNINYKVTRDDTIPKSFRSEILFYNSAYGNNTTDGTVDGYNTLRDLSRKQRVIIKQIKIGGTSLPTPLDKGLDTTRVDYGQLPAPAIEGVSPAYPNPFVVDLASPISVGNYQITKYDITTNNTSVTIRFYGSLIGDEVIAELDYTKLDFNVEITVSTQINQRQDTTALRTINLGTITGRLHITDNNEIGQQMYGATVGGTDLPLIDMTGDIRATADSLQKHATTDVTNFYVDDMIDKDKKLEFYITGGDKNTPFGVKSGHNLVDLYVVDEIGVEDYDDANPDWDTHGYDPFIFSKYIDLFKTGQFVYYDDNKIQRPYPVAVYVKLKQISGTERQALATAKTWNESHTNSNDKMDGYYLVAKDITTNTTQYVRANTVDKIYGGRVEDFVIVGVIFDFTNAGKYASEFGGPNYVPSTMKQAGNSTSTAMYVSLFANVAESEANRIKLMSDPYWEWDDEEEGIGHFIPDAFKNRAKISYRAHIPEGGEPGPGGPGGDEAYRELIKAGYAPKVKDPSIPVYPDPTIYKYVRFWDGDASTTKYTAWTADDTANNRYGKNKAYWTFGVRTDIYSNVPFSNMDNGGIVMTDTLPPWVTPPADETHPDFVLAFTDNQVMVAADSIAPSTVDPAKLSVTGALYGSGTYTIIDKKYYTVSRSEQVLTITLDFTDITQTDKDKYSPYYSFDEEKVGLKNSTTAVTPNHYYYLQVFFSTDIRGDIPDSDTTHTNTVVIDYKDKNRVPQKKTATAKFRTKRPTETIVTNVSIKKEVAEIDGEFKDILENIDVGTEYEYKITVTANSDNVKIKKITDNLPYVGDLYNNGEPRGSQWSPVFSIEATGNIVENVSMTIGGVPVVIVYGAEAQGDQWKLTSTEHSFTLTPAGGLLYNLAKNSDIIITFKAFVPDDAYNSKAINEAVVTTDDDTELEDTATVTTNPVADAIIPVEKKIIGTDAPSETFTFDLIRVTAAIGDTACIGTDAYSDSIIITNSGTNNFALTGLKAGTYYYKITEQDNGTTNWTYDKTQYIVEVEVSGKPPVATVTKVNGESTGNVIFTNTYDKPKPSKVTVTKKFENGHVPEDGVEFTVVLTSRDSSVEYTFILKADDWTCTRDDLPVGVYDVREIDIPTGYELVSISPETITVTANGGGSGDGTYDGLEWEQPGMHGNPFGAANYFSVLTFGDFKGGGADVEGGLAVGGSLRTPAGYAIGLPGWNGMVGDPIAPHEPRLLVKGDIENSITVWGGSTVVSADSGVSGTIDSMRYIGGKPFYGKSPSYGEYYADTATDFEKYDPSYTREPNSKVEQFFNKAYVDLTNLSQSYYQNPEQNNTLGRVKVISNEFPSTLHPNWYQIILDNSHTNYQYFPSDYADYDTLIFNLTLKDTGGGQARIDAIKLNMPADYSGKIIINFLPGPGVSKLYINAGDNYINGTLVGNTATWNLVREYSDRIIWNFPNPALSEISTYNNHIVASVLAPYADYKATGGSVNGILIANSVDILGGGWETHSTTKFGRNTPGTGTINITVTNRLKGGPKLPETGGRGWLLFPIIGGTLSTLAAGAFLYNRKLQYVRSRKLRRNSMYDSYQK